MGEEYRIYMDLRIGRGEEKTKGRKLLGNQMSSWRAKHLPCQATNKPTIDSFWSRRYTKVLYFVDVPVVKLRSAML